MNGLKFFEKLKKFNYFRQSFKIIPVYVGTMDSKMHKLYGEVFRKYLEDKNSFFIISTDLTHWGAK